MLTQKQLKETLHYNPETGMFTWLTVNSNRVKIGGLAGWLDKTTGYSRININKKSYQAHRLAFLYMSGRWPKHEIDHDNHIRNDNRWPNLSEVTHKENVKNMSLSKKNTSGVTGVCWHKKAGKWHVQVYAAGVKPHFGLFIDKFEAICCRMSANNKYGYHENHGRAA